MLVLRNLNWARPEPHLPTSKQDSPLPPLTPTQVAEGAAKRRRNQGPLEILHAVYVSICGNTHPYTWAHTQAQMYIDNLFAPTQAQKHIYPYTYVYHA